VVVMRDIAYIFFDEKINGNDAPLVLLLLVVNQLVGVQKRRTTQMTTTI